jgi:hypothetical protein
MLYSFVAQAPVELDLMSLTDAEAVTCIPQHPVVQSLYALLRAEGFTVREALIEVLKLQLLSGGQRTVRHTR